MSDPLFDPERQEACSLPSTAAANFRFVSDCQILPAPAPIFDCPDIDIAPDPPPQTPSPSVIASILTEQNVTTGTPGPDGDNEEGGGCDGIWWVWCPCGDTSESSGASEADPAESEHSSVASEPLECGTVPPCETAEPGHWVNQETTEPWQEGDPACPCWLGEVFGETVLIAADYCDELLEGTVDESESECCPCAGAAQGSQIPCADCVEEYYTHALCIDIAPTPCDSVNAPQAPPPLTGQQLSLVYSPLSHYHCQWFGTHATGWSAQLFGPSSYAGRPGVWYIVIHTPSVVQETYFYGEIATVDYVCGECNTFVGNWVAQDLGGGGSGCGGTSNYSSPLTIRATGGQVTVQGCPVI